ncbi:MAG: hypothetical protein KY410_01905 [Proteobacteria bacterium]|nr:hypothetical protein [Pseudomonadota bacterium]
MRTPLLAVIALAVVPSLSFAEEVIREGDIYATVDIDPDGDMKVVDLYTDLPGDVRPEIENWLENQPLVLPDTDMPPDAHRVVAVRYQVIEETDGSQALALGITDANASLPEAASKGIPVEVRVHLREDGTVASVEPLSDLPPGVDVADLEHAVAENIESDPAITEAAATDRLTESTHTMTVIIKQRED